MTRPCPLTDGLSLSIADKDNSMPFNIALQFEDEIGRAHV